jgi:hypothetical protein
MNSVQKRLGLRGADRQADDLPPAGLMNTVGDNERLVLDAPAVADLLHLGIQPQIDVVALQRPIQERADLLVELGADPADVRATDPQPEALDQLIHSARRDTTHVRLLDNRQQRPLGALARLQEAREVAALPDLRDPQLNLAGPRVPAPRPMAVAMRHAILSPLAEPGTDLLGHLGLHELLDQPAQ